MDGHARTLIGLVAVALGGACGCGPATQPAPRLDPEIVEERVDVDALDAVSDLFFDPADLATQDRERLAELPWIGSEELDALTRVPPPSDAKALAEVPGWDAALAARTAPFVRFATVVPRDRTWNVAADVIPTAARMRIELGGLEAILRAPRECPDCAAGALRARRGGLDLRLGDLRAAAAQGLLAWTSESRPEALSGWRSARGLSGTTTGRSARVVRGVGLGWQSTRAAVNLLAGRTTSGAVHLGFGTWRIRSASRFDVALGNAAGGRAASLGLVAGSSQARLAAEAVISSGLVAWTACVEARSDAGRMGARLRHAPEGFAWPLGIFPGDRSSARAAEIWCTRAWKRMGWEIGGMQAWERSSGEAPVLLREGWIALEARTSVADWELRWTTRSRLQDVFDAPATEVREEERPASRLLRATRSVSATWVATLEARDATLVRRRKAGETLRAGRLLAARLERRTGPWQPGLAVATHEIEPGVALSASTVESTLRSVRLGGDGIYLAAGLACRAGWGVARGSVGARFGPEGTPRTTCRWSVGLRWPPVQDAGR